MGHVTDCWPAWTWKHPGEIEDEMIVWTVARGRGSLAIEDDAYDLAPGDCFLLRMWESIEAVHDPAHPLLLYWNGFRILDGDGTAQDLSAWPQERLPPRHRATADLQFLLGLQRRLITPFLRGAGINPGANAWMAALLAELHAIDGARGYAGEERQQFEAIRALCSDILAESGRNWTVARMARTVHYSTDHFGKLFRRFTGQTPNDFLIAARLEAAKSLLRGSSASVTDIAAHLGYSDVYFFSRQFRTKVGVTPTKYRLEGG